ncbi:MAG: sigma-70 family RNA polymerase sigma factor [Planctomycetales bacterium]|nr:sigma-70 family RNA polymerase sigma factor [Planctomycetales bacterium]
MTASTNFQLLLESAKNGDEAAMSELVSKYETEVRLVARLRLGNALRPHLDSLDLVQSVHKSVLLGLRSSRFDISSPEKLVALALTIVRRKVARKWRKLKRQQRLSNHFGELQTLPALLAGLNTSDPDPQHEATIVEATAQVLQGLDNTEKQMIQMRLEGYTTAEIARQLGLDPDVLRVKLSRLRRRLRASGFENELL